MQTTRYIISDRLSARMMLDEEYDVVGKQSHLPFGEAMATSGEQEKHKFTSYERDTSTGLDYAVNRWHSAGVGRFLQADPIAGNGTVPQRFNRYSYTKNDPINRTDRLGLDDDDPPPPPYDPNQPPDVTLTGWDTYPDNYWEPNGETVIIYEEFLTIEKDSPNEGWTGGSPFSPCDWVWPNTLRFTGERQQHIFERHISSTMHPGASKFVFVGYPSDPQKLAIVMQLARYVFEHGKSKAYQMEGGNWVIVFGMTSNENIGGGWRIANGVGVDRDESSGAWQK